VSMSPRKVLWIWSVYLISWANWELVIWWTAQCFRSRWKKKLCWTHAREIMLCQQCCEISPTIRKHSGHFGDTLFCFDPRGGLLVLMWDFVHCLFLWKSICWLSQYVCRSNFWGLGWKGEILQQKNRYVDQKVYFNTLSSVHNLNLRFCGIWDKSPKQSLKKLQIVGAIVGS
jgi:hypothetical protein